LLGEHRRVNSRFNQAGSRFDEHSKAKAFAKLPNSGSALLNGKRFTCKTFFNIPNTQPLQTTTLVY